LALKSSSAPLAMPFVIFDVSADVSAAFVEDDGSVIFPEAFPLFLSPIVKEFMHHVF